MSEPARTEPTAAPRSDKVLTWPYLVRLEFVGACVVILILLLWSIAIDAPLEGPANFTHTPNPSKAPWYFLGLQELLVYFDPWFAGALVPVLIVVGLVLIPYLDVNPRGVGSYGWRERPFAIGTFLFGFVGLWCVPILIGALCRGPGWNFFWPWQEWDPHKAVEMTNVDLPSLLGARTPGTQLLVGLALVGGYFALAPLGWLLLRRRVTLQQLGPVRYAIVSFLLLTEGGIVLKMVLRWTLSVKYFLVIPGLVSL